MTLVDTNVLIDVLSDDPMWFDWSSAWLDQRSDIGAMFINEVILAELSVQMESEDELEQALAALRVTLTRTPIPALFIGGQAYER
jgi:predicted nucleic acid-binding protein